MSRRFEAGEVCLLLDARGRTYLTDLREGGRFQYHAGGIAHEDIIGEPPGTVLRTSSSARRQRSGGRRDPSGRPLERSSSS